MIRLAGAKAEKRNGAGITSPLCGCTIASVSFRARHSSPSLAPCASPAAWRSSNFCDASSSVWVVKSVVRSPSVSRKYNARPA